ncbi:Bug family tripartite tricarboxylate transporter substrate binding protein [Marinomonas gallaica]|uniref:Bug family tripartite tricarboxylate transporter substrate binding protein n=1 Tax=Marinomonas gallaica TaxID=1806667 RepID=UPI003A8DD46D
MKLTRTLIAAAVVSLFSLSASAYETPSKVSCIAPSSPGGGWDFTCRIGGKVMHELGISKNPVQTVNMPGAGGGVAFSHVVSKREGEEGLLIAASTAVPTRLAQGQYPGLSDDMVTWIGTLGSDYGVIAVAKDSEYQNLSQLMDAMKANAKSVKFAGASATGGWDHLKMLITAKAAGVEDLKHIGYLSFNNGGDAVTQVVGGHVDAFTGDVSEAKGFMESGHLRVLAVLSAERLPGEKFSHIPTAKEQGIDAIGPNWRGFYMPAKISPEAKQYWIDALNTMYDSPEWRAVMASNGLMPFHYSGEAFEQLIREQEKDIAELSKELGF